jgi:hypothetical protein
LPWIQPEPGGRDNFAPLQSLDWQVHIYGDPAPEINSVCAAWKLPVHVFPWRTEMSRRGLDRDAVYLIRPDGYVALADPAASPKSLTTYLDSRDISLTT